MGRLDGKVAVVTGAARGQGEAEARRFVGEGAFVVLCDVRFDDVRRVADEIGERAHAVSLDVADETSWSALVGETVDRFERVDVLVNNAAIYRSGTPLVSTTLEDYRSLIEVNQIGVFLGMRAVAPVMAQHHAGSIVNISSLAGMNGQPGAIGYVASKFAVRGMTKVAALELGPLGIRVNSIHPGVIDTPMIEGAVERFPTRRLPAQRVGQPGDVASLALFLASDESGFCTGAEFVIDGGHSAGIGFPI
ncbi:MAG TPA: glucose 1-dehydrogenase [Acidimicrobiia bacterium]|nr:glucose 1-dehydrogenase [Acidimicrobiia bacterium]